MTSRKQSSGRQVRAKSNAGAKSKYTPELVKIICDAIATQGGCQAGWTAGNISKSTFFEWKSKFSEFSDKIAQAEREYQDNLPEAQKRQAKRAFADYLFGRVQEVWISEETIEDPEKGTIHKSSVKKVTRGTPKWAIDRVLGTGIDILEIVKTLCDLGAISPEMAQLAETKLGKATSSILSAIVSGTSLEDEE